MAGTFGALNFKKLPTFAPSPVQGGISVIELPRGPTYYGIGLRYKVNGVDCTEAQAKADIRFVRLKVNGVTRFETTGKHLIDIFNRYYGLGFNAGQIFIPLARPWLKVAEAIENTAWGTANLNSFSLEVEFNSPIVNPSLEAYHLSTVYQRDLGMIIEVHESTYSAAQAGMNEISTLPRGNGDLVAIHLDSSLITACDIEINSQVYTQGTDLALLQNLVKWYSLRSPQSGYTHLDAQIRNILSDSLPLIDVSDFRLKPIFSAGGTATIIMETLSTPLGAAIPKR